MSVFPINLTFIDGPICLHLICLVRWSCDWCTPEKIVKATHWILFNKKSKLTLQSKWAPIKPILRKIHSNRWLVTFKFIMYKNKQKKIVAKTKSSVFSFRWIWHWPIFYWSEILQRSIYLLWTVFIFTPKPHSGA